MPTFTRKKKPIKATKKRRTFSRRVKKVSNSSSANKPARKLDDKKQGKSVKYAAKKQSDVNKEEILEEAETQKDAINRMIDSASSKLRDMAVESAANENDSLIQEHPETFDGISNDDERINLLEEKLKAEQRQSAKLKHEMNLVKADFEKDKKSLGKTVRSLRKEIRGKAPLEETYFFSLSKELKTAVDEIEEMVDHLEKPGTMNENKGELEVESLKNPLSAEDEKESKIEITTRIVTKPKTEVNEKKPNSATNDEEKQIKPPKKAKKMLITGGAALAIVLVFGGLLSVTMFSTPKVNDALVEEYLNKAKEGEVAGTSSQGENAEQDGESSTLQSPTMSNEVLDAVVPFGETNWQEFHDPLFGIKMQFPVNAVKMMRTDSSTTFSRREGYIFRIQMVETGHDLMNYWNQIKATNYDYDAEEFTFQGKEALDLVLKEDTEYPGNKILVKIGDVVYDIWYATASEKFSEDDIKRVDYMKKSIVFIGEESE